MKIHSAWSVVSLAPGWQLLPRLNLVPAAIAAKFGVGDKLIKFLLAGPVVQSLVCLQP